MAKWTIIAPFLAICQLCSSAVMPSRDLSVPLSLNMSMLGDDIPDEFRGSCGSADRALSENSVLMNFLEALSIVAVRTSTHKYTGELDFISSDFEDVEIRIEPPDSGKVEARFVVWGLFTLLDYTRRLPPGSRYHGSMGIFFYSGVEVCTVYADRPGSRELTGSITADTSVLAPHNIVSSRDFANLDSISSNDTSPSANNRFSMSLKWPTDTTLSPVQWVLPACGALVYISSQKRSERPSNARYFSIEGLGSGVAIELESDSREAPSQLWTYGNLATALRYGGRKFLESKNYKETEIVLKDDERPFALIKSKTGRGPPSS